MKEAKVETAVSSVRKKLDIIDKSVVISLLVTAVYFYALHSTGRMVLAYDSAACRSIVSGDITGIPDPHLLFSNYVFGLILSSFYNVLPMLNWYSLLLVFAMCFSIWAVLYRVAMVFANGSAWKQIVSCVLALVILDFFFYRDFMSIYFLNSALVAGIAAFFYIASIGDLRKRDVFIIVFLIVLSAGLRFSLFKELLPFFVIAFAIRLFVFNKKKYVLLTILGLAVIIGTMHFVDQKAYIGVYAVEREVNHYRAALQDYDKWPSYDKNKEGFKHLGIAEDEYDIMRDCLGLSMHLNAETLSEILEMGEKEAASAANWKDRINSHIIKIFEEDYTRTFWELEILSLFCCIAVIIKNRDWKMLLFFFGTFIAVCVELLYLADLGRTPVRVTAAPLVSFFLMGIAYIIQNADMWKDILNEKKIVRILVAALMIICFFGINNDSKDNHKAWNHDFYVIEREVSLEQYIMKDSENFYFVHGLHDTLDVINPVRRNYIGWGGWISETNVWKTALMGDYDDIIEALACRNDLRFIVSESTMDSLVSYLQNNGYNCTSVSEDLIVNRYGDRFVAWRIILE